ncbi:hypothetical protein CK203_094962 [Vitis vinifera]|uniref:Reverse transcriptase Ty1/copia-type domain-containing protein n=1 Tax=Vitis vinifera TaxID=29760 RepID=A0A438DQL3_VITVI|nr:hypothetical protein CK203_094962 [Vitis vinifera]
MCLCWLFSNTKGRENTSESLDLVDVFQIVGLGSNDAQPNIGSSSDETPTPQPEPIEQPSPPQPTLEIDILDISKNAHDALNVSEWKEVVFEEMRALKKNKTWEIDLCSNLMLKMSFSMAIERRRYTWIPLLALKKGLIPRQGYLQGQTDYTMFMKFLVKGKVAILIVYVNDITLTSNNIMEMDRLKKSLASKCKTKDLGSLRYFLGMGVACSKKGIVVSQRKYILDLLREIGMSG